MNNWKELSEELTGLLHLRTFPIAFKRLESAEVLKEIPRVRTINHYYTLCQALGLARTAGWTIGITGKNLDPWCAMINGLGTLHKGGDKERVGVFVDTETDAQKQIDAICKLPMGNAEAIIVSPLSAGKFEPDIVLYYCTPAQTMTSLYALQRKDYTRFQFSFVGESSCADSISECYKAGKPFVSIPCYGERTFGHVQDDELLVAIPANMIVKTIEGINLLNKAGIRCPVVFSGLQHDATEIQTLSYGEAGREKVRKAVEWPD